MPTYSQAPVKTYLETGKFKDHTPQSIPADEAAAMRDEILLMARDVMGQDNGSNDSNPADGIIDSRDDFFGNIHIEFEENQAQTQGFGTIGDEEAGGVLYARNTADALDVIIVSTTGGEEEGVMHISHKDPNGSFMTFDGL